MILLILYEHHLVNLLNRFPGTRTSHPGARPSIPGCVLFMHCQEVELIMTATAQFLLQGHPSVQKTLIKNHFILKFFRFRLKSLNTLLKVKSIKSQPLYFTVLTTCLKACTRWIVSRVSPSASHYWDSLGSLWWESTVHCQSLRGPRMYVQANRLASGCREACGRNECIAEWPISLLPFC